MKKYLFLIVPLLLNWNVYSQTETNKTYYKVELTAVYTTVNDDNGSDEYRYNMSFMGNTMSCIQQSGGPYNWYGHHRVLADQTVNNPLSNFTFSVDFFEDAA